MEPGKVNLSEKLARFNEYWSPKIVGELNGQHVKLAKLGCLVLKLRDRDVVLREGEFFIVPKGIEHKPVADEEVHVLLFEPTSTRNTGSLRNERTVEQLETI
jgi:hypothetical protein